MEQGLYRREPLRFEKGIPVFFDGGEYAANYEKISNDHIQAINTGVENPFIESQVWQEIESNTVTALVAAVKPGDRVLDIGVGTGRLLSHVPEAKRYGIDVSLNYLQRLEGKEIEVCMGSIENLPYVDGFFDVIACTDVLEHVFDLNTAISEIARTLKPGGTFILRVPYREDLAQYLAKDLPYKYVHVRSFDEHSLEILLCRIFDFSIEVTLMDYAFYPDALKGKRFMRGRRMLARGARWLVSKVSASRHFVEGLFRPVEITMVLRSRISPFP